MFKYIALSWDIESDQQSRAADALGHRITTDHQGWQLVYSISGVRVYCVGLRPGSVDLYRLADEAGIVLGTVFHRIEPAGDAIPARAAFGPRETIRVTQTSGRSLVEDYWGRYVAFVVNPNERSLFVVRSPTGELDCLTTRVQGIELFFSRAEDCPVLRADSFTIDWDFIAVQLATNLPETRQTGLKEIERLLHGECVALRCGVATRSFYWSPLQFINSPNQLDDPTAAAEELRRTARCCVGAWASCHERIIAMLSGGFDSSVVVSLLPGSSRGPHVTCVNYRNQHDPTTDERQYARAVATHRGYDLVEYDNSDEISLEQLLRVNDRPSPCQPVLAFPDPGWRRQVAHSVGATGCITGEGGDQLFFQNGAYYVCADFIYRHGLRPRAISIALDAARIEGGAMWPALRIGMRDGARRDPVAAVTANYQFSLLLSQDVSRAVQQQRLYVPEFLKCGERAPPGKCWQVFGLSLRDEMYGCHAHENDTEFLFPLMSQPVQELCFRIPTWVLTIGGQSRGLARRAFNPDVPARVLNRRSKAFSYDSMKELIARNRATLRTMLLDGLLVQQRVVDFQKLERVLSGEVTKGAGTAPDVIRAIMIENWLQSWPGARARSMAA